MLKALNAKFIIPGFLTCWASLLGAQQPTLPRPSAVDSLRMAVGAEIRVRTFQSDNWQYGHLHVVDQSSLAIESPSGARQYRFADLTDVEEKSGKRRAFAGLTGFLVGAVVGGAVGLYSGGNAAKHSVDQSYVSLATPAYGLLGAGIGGLLGAGVGVAVAPARWVHIALRLQQ